MKRFVFLAITVFLSGCGPTTHKSFVKRADALFEEMIAVLEKVEHPGDFSTLSDLKPLYIEIAELMISSIKQEERNPQLFNLEIIEAPHQEKLKMELSRVYNLEGGRKAVEMAAREGLIVLQKSPYKLKQSQKSF